MEGGLLMKHLLRYWLTGAALVAMLLMPVGASAVLSYYGILMSDAGGDGSIVGGGNWVAMGSGTYFEWTVTQNADNTWHYDYNFGHPVGETSHMIIETSMGLTADDFQNVDGDIGSIDVGLHAANSGSPGMPEGIYGIKLEDAWGLDTHVEWDIARDPMWGDFYAKDGTAGGMGMNVAWNAGFTAGGDWDPDAAATNGSLFDHILVPDTSTPPPPIPEPSTMLLLGSGLLGTAFVIRRRK